MVSSATLSAVRSNIRKLRATKAIERARASDEADINMHFVGPLIIRLDAGNPVVVLAGVHVGCFELFATKRTDWRFLK